MKRIIIVIVGVVVIVAAVYYIKTVVSHTPATINSAGQIKTAASFYPLAHFTEQVGGSHVEVMNVTPAGAEPHDYEPSPKEIADIHGAKLLVANGNGLDPWADKIKTDLESQGTLVIKMSDYFQSLPPPDAQSTADPHFWLDPALAQQEVAIIRDALIKVDPANTIYYQKNAADYVKQLQALDQEYQQGLASCKLRDVVTSHAAFGYLAKHYGLNQIAIAGLSPDQEPSSSRMAEIAQLAKQKQIKYIFFETLVSPKLADTIATEVGAQTMVFNPLEGLTAADIAAGKTYISVMQDNLKNLRMALQCN